MNYAQLIDPEWAQAGYPERHPARRRAVPEFDLRVVTKHETAPGNPPQGKPRGWGRRTGVVRRICLVLAEAKRPLTAVEIAALDGEIRTAQVSTAMKNLVDGGRVRRSGPWGEYAYAITVKGRAWF